jgi:hypothetical protein
MTRDQARKLRLSGAFLTSYIAGAGDVLPPPNRELIDLTDGNFLLASAVIGMLAPLRRKSFDEVLDDLPARDEGFPDNPAATPMWATTLDILRYARGNGWQNLPYPTSIYDMPTAFRNSFNLAMVVTFEFAARTGQPPAYVAKTFADAAVLGDLGPSEDERGHLEPGRSPRTVTWFG